MKTKNGKATFGKVKRQVYQPQEGGKLETSKQMAQMRAIAFNPSTARQIINRLENQRDDDALERKAEEKRQRKNAKRAALLKV